MLATPSPAVHRPQNRTTHSRKEPFHRDLRILLSMLQGCPSTQRRCWGSRVEDRLSCLDGLRGAWDGGEEHAGVGQ